jgi:hypothetical protein
MSTPTQDYRRLCCLYSNKLVNFALSKRTLENPVKRYLLLTAVVALVGGPAHAQDAETARSFAVVVGVHAACLTERLPGNLSTQLDLMSEGILRGYSQYYYGPLNAAHDQGELEGRERADELGCEKAAKQSIENLPEAW